MTDTINFLGLLLGRKLSTKEINKHAKGFDSKAVNNMIDKLTTQGLIESQEVDNQQKFILTIAGKEVILDHFGRSW